VTSQQLAAHWTKLARRLEGAPAAPLRGGAEVARALLEELAGRTAAYGLHGFPSAQGVGGRLAGVRNTAADLVLERNQALRLALLDVEHVLILLAYLRALAEQRGDAPLAAFHQAWETRLRAVETDARAAVMALAGDPEGAVQPADTSALGRASHTFANAIGTMGEAVDGSPVGRAARKLSGK
jgi:hypothetical protein